MDKTALIDSINNGFKSLNVAAKFKQDALKNIEIWLSDSLYKDYIPQIEYLVDSGKWDLLLDSFYQVIPFGTGGRRGMVGIGPNRINGITITMSAQGHSQYLLRKYGVDSASRGVVIAYDVRKFLKKGIFDDSRLNPIRELSCEDLAKMAAEVYAANGIKVYLFKSVASTPELSFTVRYLNALAGDMISASHNPPEFNGKKVVDEHGGQLIPPHDEELVNVVVNEVKEIKRLSLNEAEAKGLVEYLSEAEHEQYLKAASQTGLNDYRSARILYSSFHGTSHTSAFEVLKRKGFDVLLDPESSSPDPAFPSLMFNIPNPEVIEAYKNLMPNADKVNADIIIVADPDGDRIGLMSKENDGWRFYNGNEILVLATAYLLEEKKKQGSLSSSNVIVKTAVTTNFLKVLAREYNVEIVPDLLVGIKYVADIMNKLEKEGRIDDFLIGGEESHGSVAGNYIRDKDTSVPAVLVSELASREKDKGSSLGQYLDNLYERYGYFRNYLTEIRLPGAEGMSKMALIQEDLRNTPPQKMGEFEISEQLDFWKGEPFLSETDKVSRNVIILRFKPIAPFASIQVTIRPSGTEPKTKMYFEIGMVPNEQSSLPEEKEEAEKFLKEIEKAVIKYCYKIIGIDFPDRGFLLFWQLSAIEKMHYFEIEPKIEELVNEPDRAVKEKKLNELLDFLGSNPIEKIDKAFIAKYSKGIREFLELN